MKTLTIKQVFIFLGLKKEITVRVSRLNAFRFFPQEYGWVDHPLYHWLYYGFSFSEA